MGEFPEIRIDKSLARGIFRQEVRQATGHVLGDTAKVGILDLSDLDDFFLNEIFSKISRGKPSFPVQSYRHVVRAVKAKPLKPCEEVYQSKAVVVRGSSQKSWLEVSYRKRPVLLEDVLPGATCYAFVKKDRMVTARRPFPVVALGHAIRRYLQRGDIRIGESVLAPALSEIYARTGLFFFLANLAGRDEGGRFAVPFKEGFLLCEVLLSTVGARIEYLLLDDPDTDRTEQGSVECHVHPLLWGARKGTRMIVKVNTYVGRREMKDGQAALHDLLEGVYQRAKKEIDLLGMAEGCFYPGHLPEVQERLSLASRRLDDAARDIMTALSCDRRMAYAFMKEDAFDAAAVRLPSQDIALAEKGAGWVRGLQETFGLAARGGGLFCHRPSHGLYEAPEGGPFQTHEVSFLFSLDPYEEGPAEAKRRIKIIL